MDIGVISIRYARALLKAAIAEKVEENVCNDMLTLAKNFMTLPQLRQAIDNPMLSKDKKRTLLVSASGENATKLTAKFFDLVLKEDRENIIQFMANSYVTLYRKEKNIIRGKLTTAVNVSPDIERKMRQMVEQKTNGTVEFETEVDSSIIGGFILEYDTYRLDASVQSKLNNILLQLSK